MGIFNINRLRIRTGRLLTENNQIINEADYLKAALEGTTIFNESVVVKRTPIINLSSIFPLSAFRDVTTGTVNNLADSYQVTPGSTLESAQLGVYIPGFGANVGVGFRFDPADGCETDWGYFDSQNGYMFRYTPANGYQLGIRKAGTTNFINRADWNVDKLDGTGPSGVTLDLSKGYIFEIDFSWYGYGPIIWKIIPKTFVGGIKPKASVIHIESVQDGTSVENANLPISVNNFGTVGNVIVTGRQFSIIGDYLTERRSTGRTVQRNVDGAWEPVISFRRKAGESIYTLKTENFTIINSSTDIIEYQLLLNSAPIGGSIVTPENRSPGETAVEFNIGATDFSGGEMFFSDIAPGSSRSASSGGLAGVDETLNKEIPRDFWVTLVARTLSGATGAALTAHLNVVEQW